MFNIFRRKKEEAHRFEKLENSEWKDKYFVRTMQWDWLNETMIHVFDNKRPRMITMDPWFQQVFLDAEGRKTVKEYVLWMADQYKKGQIPKELDETILKVISDLINDGRMIELKDQITILPEDIKEPRQLGKQNP